MDPVADENHVSGGRRDGRSRRILVILGIVLVAMALVAIAAGGYLHYRWRQDPEGQPRWLTQLVADHHPDDREAGLAYLHLLLRGWTDDLDGTYRAWCGHNDFLYRVHGWRDGVRHGVWEDYFGDIDQVMERGTYVDGRKHGRWEYYGRDGRLLCSSHWEHGICDPERSLHYHTDGTPYDPEPDEEL